MKIEFSSMQPDFTSRSGGFNTYPIGFNRREPDSYNCISSRKSTITPTNPQADGLPNT
jgi:hypothetical protein